MATNTMDLVPWLRKQLENEDGDLLAEMVKTFVNQLMGAEADALCGAGYGERSPERVNSRNGYRAREFDTRVGTIELAIPKLREGSYYPDWLLQARRRDLIGNGCYCLIPAQGDKPGERDLPNPGYRPKRKTAFRQDKKHERKEGGQGPRP